MQKNLNNSDWQIGKSEILGDANDESDKIPYGYVWKSFGENS
jgi:hypothetical protein